jgi:ABC-2 type transport system permease protein
VKQALHAEWTKTRTVAGTCWLLVGVVGLTVALSALVSLSTKCGSASCGDDPAKVSLTGIYLGQAVVAVLAVLAISDEYGTDMIHITFTAMPRRVSVLAAKAAVVGGLVLVASAVAVLASVLIGHQALPGNGFTAANGYPSLSLSLTSGPMLRAAVGTVLYLGLIALLSLGVATMVRDAAVAIGIVLALLFLFPIIAHFVGNPTWQRHIEQIGPTTAGLAIQDTVNLAAQPIGPWPGLAVLAAWAAGALLLAALLLSRRDA